MILQYLKQKLDKESKKLIRNSSWVFIANINSAFCFFVRSILLARLLSADGFGLFVLIGTYLKALLEITNLNLPTALTKFGANYLDKDKVGKLIYLIKVFVLASIVTTCIALTILHYVLSNYYDTLISEPQLYNNIMLYGIAIGGTLVTQIFTTVLHLSNKFKFHSMLNIFQDWVEFSIIIYFSIFTDADIKSLLLLLALAIISHSVMYIVSAIYLLRDDVPLFRKKSTHLSRESIREMLRFILINSPSNTILMGVRYVDTITLGMLADNAQVAYYTIAKRLGGFILRFTDPMNRSIYPQLSILVSKERYQDLRTLISNILKYGSGVIVLILIVGYLISKDVILFLYGDDFIASYDSFLILLLSGCVSAITFWLNPLVLSLGLVKERFIANILALTYLVPSAIYFTSNFGSFGTAITMLSGNVLYQYILSRYVYREMTRLDIRHG